MVFKKMLKILITCIFIIFQIFHYSLSSAANSDFDKWLKEFKIIAVNEGISKNVVNEVMSDAKFLPKVIENNNINKFSNYLN